MRGTPLPRLWAGLTTMSAAFLNEVVENTGEFRTAPDHLANLLIFDIGGVMAFNLDFLNRFRFWKRDGETYRARRPDSRVHDIHEMGYGGRTTTATTRC